MIIFFGQHYKTKLLLHLLEGSLAHCVGLSRPEPENKQEYLQSEKISDNKIHASLMSRVTFDIHKHIYRVGLSKDQQSKVE
jgi:hypothetical protein